MSVDTEEHKDTAKYKPIKCYQCGETMRSYLFHDVWDMRVDGKICKVPLWNIPCHRCDTCDIAVTDGGSDDAIVQSYKQYLKDNNLNTPWLLVRRFVRKQIWRVRDRWNYWTYKTFYKKKEQHAAT